MNMPVTSPGRALPVFKNVDLKNFPKAGMEEQAYKHQGRSITAPILKNKYGQTKRRNLTLDAPTRDSQVITKIIAGPISKHQRNKPYILKEQGFVTQGLTNQQDQTTQMREHESSTDLNKMNKFSSQNSLSHTPMDL